MIIHKIIHQTTLEEITLDKFETQLTTDYDFKISMIIGHQ